MSPMMTGQQLRGVSAAAVEVKGATVHCRTDTTDRCHDLGGSVQGCQRQTPEDKLTKDAKAAKATVKGASRA